MAGAAAAMAAAAAAIAARPRVAILGAREKERVKASGYARGGTPFRGFISSLAVSTNFSGQGYGLLYEILTRFGPERSRENERIAQAIFRGLRLRMLPL